MSEVKEVVETKETKKEKKTVKFPAVPSAIAEIDKEYIQDFIANGIAEGKITLEQFNKLDNAYVKAKEEHDTRYFMSYRKAFAEMFFPKLAANAGKPNGESFDDFLTRMRKQFK